MFKFLLLSLILIASVIFANHDAPGPDGIFWNDFKKTHVEHRRFTADLAGFRAWSLSIPNAEHLSHSRPHQLFKDDGSLRDDAAARRFATWLDNRRYVQQHNARFARGDVSFWLGLNKFGAMTNQEYRKTMLRPAPRGRRLQQQLQRTPPAQRPVKKKAAEWRNQNWIARGTQVGVLNQGQCGSCWSFSATQAAAAQFNLKNHNNNRTAMPHQCNTSCVGGDEDLKQKCCCFSAQQCADCTNSGTDGCNIGGEPHNCTLWIAKHNGGFINTCEQYPYASGTTHHLTPCRARPDPVQTRIVGYKQISGAPTGHPNCSEALLTDAIQEYPAISVGIDASAMSFQFYVNGIYYNEGSCSNNPDLLDHGVVVVGVLLSGEPPHLPTPPPTPAPPPTPPLSYCDHHYYRGECVEAKGCYWCWNSRHNFGWCQNEECSNATASSSSAVDTIENVDFNLLHGKKGHGGYLVRNSWGSWGCRATATSGHGYIWMARMYDNHNVNNTCGSENMCGIASDAMVAVFDDEV